jgi:hypothetical protein
MADHAVPDRDLPDPSLPPSPAAASPDAPALPAGLRARLAALLPGAVVESVVALGPDEAAQEGATQEAAARGRQALKALGYGRPLRVALRRPDGERTAVVLHTALPNDFGHDRRADRAEAMLLAYDTFASVPGHVRALDVGAIAADGTLISLASSGEFYLITEWADGTLYADDLRRVARTGEATPRDLARAEALARHLAALHARPGSHEGAYARAIRDLLGHGEGIAGISDGYPPDTPAAPPARLEALETACLRWRWKLRGRFERLRRTHGDFHPFNVLFQGGDGGAPDAPGRVVLLDASRGSEGDPADDVAALTINYLFFGVGDAERPRWSAGLGRLWERFFVTYLEAQREVDVLAALAPFYAWRALVVASPLWYPDLSAEARDRILGFAERALAAPRFDPAWGAEVMA